MTPSRVGPVPPSYALERPVALSFRMAARSVRKFRATSRKSLWVTIPAALLLLGFSILKLRGPKCVCHVITAVSMDRIPALYRLKTAEKTLRIVQPLIEEAQREPAPPPAVEQARAEQAP